MSVKKNFIYSSILTISNYLFPLLTFPYVSRVLGVTNIGICNYIDSIITYFCVFSAMGVSVVGVREIARFSNQKDKRSDAFLSILFINALFTVLSIFILFLCTHFIQDFFQYRNLFYIGILKLISNLFLVEWFYKGIEDFGYITKRTIIVKTLYVISVFIFIRCPNDYATYLFLTVFQLTINASINILHLRKFVVFKSVNIEIAPYIKSYLTMGMYTILTTMYTTFNIAILGYISGPVEVGYFTTSTKIFSIILAIYTAFTGVMLPRMSSLLANHEKEKFLSLINKSTGVLFVFAFPAIVYFTVFSSEIIYLIGGSEYEGAIVPFRIIMPAILVVGYEQILIIQALMPMKKDRAIFINSCIGACVGLIFNFLLIPLYGSIGTSIAYCLCEISVFCSALFFISKYTRFQFPFREIIRHLTFNIPLIIICLLGYNYNVNPIRKLFITGGVVCIYVYINNYYIMKNLLFIQLVDNVKFKIWRVLR